MARKNNSRTAAPVLTGVAAMTQDRFNSMIARIKTVGHLTNAMIQQCAVWAIFQSIQHRNATPATALLEAMPAGTRRQSLIEFMEKHGNLAYLSTGKKFEFFDVEDKTGVRPVYDEEKLMTNAWFRAKPEADLTSSKSAYVEAEKFLSKLRRLSENGRLTAGDDTLVSKLADLLDEFKPDEDRAIDRAGRVDDPVDEEETA